MGTHTHAPEEGGLSRTCGHGDGVKILPISIKFLSFSIEILTISIEILSSSIEILTMSMEILPFSIEILSFPFEIHNDNSNRGFAGLRRSRFVVVL